jgi:predicted metalloprotease with PDZ domain
VLASVGERTDSVEVEGRMIRTRWVTPEPIRNASFNLGLFKSYQLESGTPPVSVLYSEEAHKELGWKAFAREEVGADVEGSLKFFGHVFGGLPVKRLYATEIPYEHGEAFPGLIHLSLSTFVDTDIDGFDEFFRAHEVAHQWWGIGVDYATYHDRWMSEGFASFAGLWYLQTARNDSKKYFGMLDRWKANIMLRRDNGKPVWLGHRVAEAKDGSDYNALVYEKGAWAVHMLRILMIDLKTMSEDRFTNAMRDFYGTYRGRRASTEDFRRIIEKHNGADMGWFFNQWIYGSAIPTYRVSWTSQPTDGGKHKVHLKVIQENVPDDFQMFVPVTIDLGNDAFARLRVKVKGPVTELDLPVLLPGKPKGVKFNDMEGVLAEVK